MTHIPSSAKDSLFAFLAIWFKVGLISFGGPAGQIALMHRIAVDEKKWLDEPHYLGALNFCMLLPGPEAQQLATYIGYHQRGLLGGILAGSLFIFPGLLIMVLMAVFYTAGQSNPLVIAIFLGVKAAVLAILLQALIRLSRKSLGNLPLLLTGIAAFLMLYALSLPFPLVLGLAATAGALYHLAHPGAGAASPDLVVQREAWQKTALRAIVLAGLWLLPLLGLFWVLGEGHILVEVGGFFARLAVVSFGGAYAALTYLAQEGVQSYGWLSLSQMADGLGLAETTPGPLVLVTQFVAYLAGFQSEGGTLTLGLFAVLVSAWALYLPSFLWIFTLAPHMQTLLANQRLKIILQFIAAAVVGVIANLAVYFALATLFAERSELTGPFGPVLVPDFATLNGQAALLSCVSLLLVFVFRQGVVPLLAAMSVLASTLFFLGF